MFCTRNNSKCWVFNFVYHLVTETLANLQHVATQNVQLTHYTMMIWSRAWTELTAREGFSWQAWYSNARVHTEGPECKQGIKAPSTTGAAHTLTSSATSHAVAETSPQTWHRDLGETQPSHTSGQRLPVHSSHPKWHQVPLFS